MTTTTAAETFAFDASDLDLGFFTIETSGERYRWLWFEKQGIPESLSGTWYSTRSVALRKAADFWDRQGSGGDLLLRLREASTAAERQERGLTGDVPVDTEKYAFDPEKLDSGFYIIETSARGDAFRWVWFDNPNTRDTESDRWYDKRSTALRKAAEDWDYAGDDGDLSQRLREAAARAEANEPAKQEPIIPSEVRIVPRDGRPVIDLDQNRDFGQRFALHLCEVWGWLPDEPEAHDLGQRAATALSHAVAGTRTSADSLMSSILYIPTGHAPNEVYDKTVKDLRAAIIAADPTVSDAALAVFDRPNPYPVHDRS